MTLGSHIRTISQNGRVTIPAEARARWNTRKVVVVDLGDMVVVRPASDDPIGDIQRKYQGRGPSSDEARRQARAEDAAREDARGR